MPAIGFPKQKQVFYLFSVMSGTQPFLRVAGFHIRKSKSTVHQKTLCNLPFNISPVLGEKHIRHLKPYQALCYNINAMVDSVLDGHFPLQVDS